MRVAAIQFAPLLRGVRRNLRTAENLVTQAVRAGAEVIVLPELCTTGYSFMSYEEALPYAENLKSIGSPTESSMALFGGLCAKHNVAIAWGVMERDGDNLYNSQVLMFPNGNMRTYRKINLWGQDRLWAEKGTESPPITTYKGKNIGLLICRDVRDKGGKGSVLKDFYEKGDADIVVFSANFGDGEFPSTSWVEFAEDNATWLVVSNRYGREANNNFGEGGICVIEPSGKVHCQGLIWNSPCMVLHDIP